MSEEEEICEKGIDDEDREVKVIEDRTECSVCTCKDSDQDSCKIHQNNIWKFFNKAEKGKVFCRICESEQIFMSNSNGISSLESHLQRVHPMTYASMSSIVDLPNDKLQLLIPAVTTPKRRKRQAGRNPYSVVWRWFQRLGERLVSCRVCMMSLAYSPSAHSNLKVHLKRHHPKQFVKLNKLQEQRRLQKNKSESVIEGTADAEVDQTDDHGQANTIIMKEISVKDGPEGSHCTCGAGVQDAHRCECGHSLPFSWQYFENIKLNTAQCRLCDMEVTWHTNVDTLRKHIEDMHSHIKLKKDPESKSSRVVMIEESYLDEEMLDESFLHSNMEDYTDARPESDTEQNNKPNKSRATNRDSKPDTRHDTLSCGAWEASIDCFGQYVAALMKMLPRERATRYQAQIVERLIKESIKYSEK